ncbi:hypothetical protein BGX34_001927 [Mortierella sp. NVP85]|nr:hypothetical protein BGX34_001927 [Mortierella sp. NVP85]
MPTTLSIPAPVTTTTITTITAIAAMPPTLSMSDPIATPSVSFTKQALDCPEVLHAIGKWIPVFVRGVFKPKTLLDCCLVSKHWNRTLTPLLWRVDDKRSMAKVPQAVMEKHKKHVWIYYALHEGTYWPNYMPPMYTHLRELTMGSAIKAGKVAMRMIGMNNRLRTLSLSRILLFQELRENESKVTKKNKGKGITEKTFSLTNPLGHLWSTLEELDLRQMQFQEMEFYYLLRAVAKGSLRSLYLDNISGTMDLQDIVFESLKRLRLQLDSSMQPALHEIVGRSPHLVHLEITGHTYPLEPLAHVLRGTRREETPRERGDRLRAGKPEPRRWSRPQLETLLIQGLHFRKRQDNAREEGNDAMFLELVRASGCFYNKRNEMINPSSLRELDIPLWVLDDLARRAIEASSLTLEVLKLHIQRDRGSVPTWKHERQGRVLRKIFQSCSRLRVMEFWDQNGDEDISVIMAGLVGDYGGLYHDSGYDGSGTESENGDKVRKTEALVCPDLVTLTLKSTRMHPVMYTWQMEEERQYFDNEEGHGDINENGTSPWVMVKQQWDPTLQDGTGFLLDAHWNSFELYEDVVEDVGLVNEGDRLLRRFFRQFSTSKKLKELQLGQLRFTRAVGESES